MKHKTLNRLTPQYQDQKTAILLANFSHASGVTVGVAMLYTWESISLLIQHISPNLKTSRWKISMKSDIHDSRPSGFGDDPTF